MLSELTFNLLNNYLKNFISIKSGKTSALKPLFFTYYATLSCNFRCSYCDFARRGQNSVSSTELNTKDVIKLMSIIIKDSSHIYLTGGEPLLRKDIVEILKACKELGYKSIALNTNMSLIHKNMDVLDYISNLVASFDMLDQKEYSKILGTSESTVEQVRNNIIDCARLQREKNFRMTINCVIIPESIGYVCEVMDFCFEHNIRFAVVPAELSGGKINDRLKESEEYRRLIKDIIKAKENGKPVFGSRKYLDTICNFKQFDCYPTLTPHVYPNGDLFYPCQPMLKVAANLLEVGSYKKALEIGIKKFGDLPMCKDRCHKACYIEPSMLVKNPFLLPSSSSCAGLLTSPGTFR